ncbi:MAG: hypothetical protein ACW99G_03505 [Candidatus Thorarchaeota archaeon]
MIDGNEKKVAVFKQVHGLELIDETVKLTNKKRKKFFTSITNKPFNQEEKIKIPIEKFQELVTKTLPNISCFYRSTVWKDSIRNNKSRIILESFKKHKILAVGFSHLSNIGVRCDLDYTHYHVDFDATAKRNAILSDLKRLSGQYSMLLFQCGELLSSWFICNLHQYNCILIDAGRSLDYWSSLKFTEIEKESCVNNTGRSVEEIFPDADDELWLRGIE